jgi:hypothetical protein
MTLNHRTLLLALLPLAACFDLDHEVGTLEESADAVGVAGLVVDVEAGDLVLSGESDRETIDVLVRVRSAVGSDSNDEEVLAATRVAFEEESDGVLKLVVRVPDNYPAYSADVEVLVPVGQDVEVRDGSGDIVIGEVGSLRVDDGSGDLVVDGVAGDADIRDGSGDIVLTHVSGDVRVDDGSGDLVIEHVRGTVTITDGSGDITVRDADDVVLLDDGSGDTRID